MKKSIRVMAAMLALVLLSSISAEASESSSYTYTQSVDKEWIRTQDAYMPGTILLNDGTLASPAVLYV